MYTAKIWCLVACIKHSTLRNYGYVQQVKHWFVVILLFLKHLLFLFVHWSSNKGQAPACPGQHTEDLNFSRDFQLPCKALSCTAARLVTAQHSVRFAHVPQLQMWSRTQAAQPRGREQNPLHTHSTAVQMTSPSATQIISRQNGNVIPDGGRAKVSRRDLRTPQV